MGKRFILSERIDYLGAPSDGLLQTGVTLYDGSVDGEVLMLPPPPSSLVDLDRRFGYLTVMNDVRVRSNASCVRGDGRYCIDDKLFKGGHGEVWRAHRVSADGKVEQHTSFVLKRMHVAGRPDILRCALREVYFGELLQGVRGVARYVSYFSDDDDYWLVFRDGQARP